MATILYLVTRKDSNKILLFQLGENGILSNETEGYRVNGKKQWDISNCERFFDEMGMDIIEMLII